MQPRSATLAAFPERQLWVTALAQIPATFGRLVYLSSLRDFNTGAYKHFGLARQHSPGDIDAACRRCHYQSFLEWLSFTLEGKKADLDLYLVTLNANKRTVLETWVREKPYRNLIPMGASIAERDLFNSDLAALLGLLINVSGVVCECRDA